MRRPRCLHPPLEATSVEAAASADFSRLPLHLHSPPRGFPISTDSSQSARSGLTPHPISALATVLEVDFYRADALAEITDDDELSALALRAAAAALGIDAAELDASLVVDSAVVRARRAVSHFAVGSAALSPGVKLGDGLYACGDWIDRAGHASWSTEKSVVTGRQAAAAIGRDLGLAKVDATVIPAAADSPPLQALRQIAGAVRTAVPPSVAFSETGLPRPPPWVGLSR